MPCRSGNHVELLYADMSTMVGKLDTIVAVVNILRLLRALANRVPLIAWAVGRSFTVKNDGSTTISRVTNMGGGCA